jgi:hypothetical protein
MRAPGMPMGFMQILSAGPMPNPTYLGSAVGTAFLTPEQGFFKAMRKKYGDDDPDAGGYSLAQIDWDKDDGSCTYSPMEATAGGWYGM